MWRLVWATVAGAFEGALFDRYLRHLPHAEVVPDGFGPADASDEVDAAGDAVTKLFAHLGLTEERQRLLARGLQLALAGLVVAGLVTLDLNVVVNAGVGLGATLLPGVLRRDYHLPVDAGLTLWIAVAVFLHVLGSSGFYQTVWGWHNLTHAVSGTLVAGAGYTAVSAVESHTDSVSFPVEFTFVFVVLFVFSVGVFWEMHEFTLDGVAALAGTEDVVLAQHGLEDTMSDMMANTFGALLVATAATLWRSGRVEWS